MFKHILAATDGSPLADKAVAKAFEVAAASEGTRVTLLTVVPDYATQQVVAYVLSNAAPSLDEVRVRLANEGQRLLDEVIKRHHTPKKTKAAVDTHVSVSDYPYDEIVHQADRLHCDLIVMAARGRGAVASALLGSQTARVMALSNVPVLVVK